MNPMLSMIFMLGALILAALAIGLAVFFFWRYNSPEPSLLQQRLIHLKELDAEEQTSLHKDKLQKLAKLYKDADYKNDALGKWLERFSLFLRLKILIQQAGMKTPADQFFLNNMVIPALLFLILGIAISFPPLILFGPCWVGGAYAFVAFKKKRRQNKFVTQLPDALSLITSALRAGHSFQSALTVVSTELPDPMSTEFSLAVRDINLGIPVKDALGRMVARLGELPDMRMFSTAVLIQREAGGNLAEVLEKLGYTIRERFKLKGQISALTGQSRLTGMVLGSAPAVLLTGLSLFVYDYVSPLWETEMGNVALGVAVFLQIVGFVIMRKIIDIRV